MNLGLNSLNERLNTLEDKLNVEGPNMNFIEKMRHEKEISDQKKRIQQYEKIKFEYNNTIKLLTFDDIKKNFSRVVEISVRFVEEHAKKICAIFELAYQSDFKFKLCLDLILSVVDIALYTFDLGFISELINHFVELLFPHKNSIDKKEPDKLLKKEKRRNSFFKTIKLR
jgi:hypothetical protein